MNILVFIQNENDKISRSSIEVICGMQKISSKSNGTISTVSLENSINDEICNYNIASNYFVEG